jgi:hypothetical protein
MFRGSLSIAALAMLVGCAGSPSASDGDTSSSSDALTRSIPQRDWFAIDLSADGATPAGVSTKSLNPLDTPAAPAPVCDSSQNADFAALSAKISGDANGVLGNILGVVEAVTANPPVAHDDRHAVWGPITSPTAPSVYRLVLEKKDDKVVSFLLAGRPKDGDDSSWKAVFAGSVAAPDDAHRAGDAHVDFDAMHGLDPSSDPTAGGLNLHFEAEGTARAVDITFGGIAGKAAPSPSDAIYHFRGDARVGGTFDFVTHSDFDGDGKADELVNVKSRFGGLGGQALITVMKDGAAKPIAATQCWNGGAKLVFYADDTGTRPPAGALECCPK